MIMSNKLITKIGYYSIYETTSKKYVVDSGKTIHLKKYHKIIINPNRDLKEFNTLAESKKYIKSKLVKKTKEREKKLSKIPKSLYLVILKEESTGKSFVKVGITSKRFIMRRFSKIYGYEGYALETILRRIDTDLAEKLEDEIKKTLNKKKSVKKYRPVLESFSGYSECYDYLCLSEIVSTFDDLTKGC
jgi:nitrogenase molybdenum-iron protein alpha/beta subunit